MEWHEEDQLKEQLVEDQEMEENLERKKVDGGAWQVEALQKVPELVAQKRVSRCDKG